ncbi:MAG TPA: class C sortase, partial [Clostridiales bacterium]|nr:class C sortase [Clostridiales bacterium]
MRKHASTIALILILVVGLSLMLYPSFSNRWNEAHQSRAIANYSQEVAKLDDNRYGELWQQAQAYNRSLVGRENAYLLDDDQREEYERLLDVSGMGIMGYIEIPSLNVSLPIYHGTEDSVLQVAVGHLEWTSLPVGGESTHCVLSGHRGLPSARLFT